jgi:hypothetical protein
MTLKKIQSEIDDARKKLIGKYCFACGRSRPIDQFDMVAKKSVTKCRNCKAKYGNKK